MNYNQYRLYGRSKGRGKNKNITKNANLLKIKKIKSYNYNVIDIGVGYGESTLEIAKQDNSKKIIACEKFIDGINKIAEDVSQYNLDNINIFHGNVNQFLDEYCLQDSISEVFILFPDPWPKKKHFKRRLINDDFFKKLKKFLKRGAIIHMASDSRSYISAIMLTVYNSRKDYKWINQQKDNWDYSNVSMPKTKYFRKALEKGYNPIYLKLMKI